MFSGYMYPYYRSPYFGGYGYPSYSWGYSGYSGYPGYSYGGTNIIGSAIANQNMNVIGSGAIGGSQFATPTVIW